MPAWCPDMVTPNCIITRPLCNQGLAGLFTSPIIAGWHHQCAALLETGERGVLYVILLYNWCHNCHNTSSDHWCHLNPLTRGHDGMCEGCDGGPDNVTLFTRTPRVFLITTSTKKYNYAITPISAHNISQIMQRNPDEQEFRLSAYVIKIWDF